MRLTTVATFLTPEDAEVARIDLESEGITTFLEGATVVGFAWIYGNAVGWIKLQVAEDDEERAREILSQHFDDSSPGAARSCPACGVEVPANFGICWSCEASMDTSTAESLPQSPPRLSALPTTEHEDADSDAVTASGDAMAWRAFTAAVVGLLACPPLLHIYSLWVLVRLAFQEKALSRKGQWIFWLAAFVSMAVCLYAIWVLSLMCRPSDYCPPGGNHAFVKEEIIL